MEGKALPIPRLLGIPWWWLFLVGIAESGVRYFLHVPDWMPSVTGLWWVVQALWLRAAEPRSRAIYLYFAAEVLSFVIGVLPNRWSDRWDVALASIFVAVLYIAAVFVFRSEMEHHFNTTEPRGLVLGGVMTFLLNILYFQQNDPNCVLAVVVER
jgi:hypothetical protein